jgi:hypothetical protein
MANNRYKPEEIATKLRKVEVLVGQGMARSVDLNAISVPVRWMQSLHLTPDPSHHVLWRVLDLIKTKRSRDLFHVCRGPSLERQLTKRMG